MPEVSTPLHGDHNVPEGFNLIEHAKKITADAVAKLTEAEEDILPILMWRGPYGIGVMPLLDMADDAAKDALAEQMTTVLGVSRATEAVQLTTSWTVRVPTEEDVPFDRENPLDGLRASEHPDRAEVICLMYMSVEEDQDKMLLGNLTRYEDKPPTMSSWQTEESAMTERVAGRFGDAAHMGMDLAAAMPPALVEIINAGWHRGEQEQLMQRFHNVFTQFSALMGAMRGGVPDGS